MNKLQFLILLIGITFGISHFTIAQEMNGTIALADSALKMGEFKVAIKNYEKAYSKNKKDENTANKLAEGYLAYSKELSKQENYEPALIFYQKFLKARKRFNPVSTNESVESHIGFADGYLYRNRDYQKAARLYKKILKMEKKAGTTKHIHSVTQKLAECFVELNNFSTAKNYYGRIYGKERDLNEVADSMYCQAKAYESSARLYRTLRDGLKIKDPYDIQIARSYWGNRDMEKALEWYSKFLSEKDIRKLDSVITINANFDGCEQELESKYGMFLTDNNKVEDIDVFRYAQVLLNLSGKYYGARSLLDKFTIVVEEDPNAPKSAFQQQKTFLLNKLNSQSINSKDSEFGPTIYKDNKLIFVSDRNTDGTKTKTLNGEERSTLDLYVSKLNKKDLLGFYLPENNSGITSNFKDTIKTLPSKFINVNRDINYNEGTMTFYPDNWNKLVFTGNTFNNQQNFKDSKSFEKVKINTLKLFIAERESDTIAWKVDQIRFTGPEAHIFNDEKYSIGHPTLSKNGTRLFFASDAPIRSSFGNSDLYYSDYNEETKEWQGPVNLGKNINTSGNEVFPFYHLDKDSIATLYYSSNAPGGFGGLDIYKSAVTNDSLFSDPVNMGDETDSLNSINSSKDDFAIILNKNGSCGYFSSDRGDSTKLDDDIYKFRIMKIEVYVFDENTKLPIPTAKVNLFQEGGAPVGVPMNVDIEGKASYHKFALNQRFNAFAGAPGYRPGRNGFSSNLDSIPDNGIIRIDIYLDRSPNVELIILANVKGEQQVLFNFDKDVYELNEQNILQKDKLYELFFTNGINYLGNTELTGSNVQIFDQSDPFEIKNLEDSVAQANLTSLLQFNGIIVKNITLIRNIRYNFATNEFNKKDDAKVIPEKEFTKVAQVLYKYPHLDLKLSSHTDRCPLDGNYDNKALSGRRNQAAVTYILDTLNTFQIAENRIKQCAYTYEYPVDEHYGKDGCRNDFNRRTEFKLVYKGREGYVFDCICDPSMLEYSGKPTQKRKRLPKNLGGN
ncbi:MAG: hypothetical protein KTR26_01065 [Flammeovirgaceae bacterium]|nr:hypothetical protein [Flammeovirgaceae bacterium]